jgi:hypothetical protein
MIESTYIEKNRSDSAGPDFAALRTEGIRLLQELCGRHWTDYNLHDPGVTILEQLCYALTDLMYRTEFDVADYLTDENGHIDFKKQALFRPQEIFPSQPITLDDYRGLIYNALPESDNVWIYPARDNGSANGDSQDQGFYQIYVKLREKTGLSGSADARDQTHERIEEKVKKIYAANRNLCEDLKAVIIVGHHHYRLLGTIEIAGPRNPSDILAELYFKCSQHISPGIKVLPFEEMLSQGKSLEEIFTGPPTNLGYLPEEMPERQRRWITIAQLIGIISDIEGVKYVTDLWFADEDQQGRKREKSIPYPASLKSVPCLRLPRNDTEIEIKLCKNGREHRTSFRQALIEFNRLKFENDARRHTRRDVASVYTAPQGQYRNLGEYYSIQNHFPSIYGINRYGVPESEPPARKAKAKQLKAYLLLFEQIMANFLAGLPQMAKLFSVDEKLHQSYFHQQLGQDNIPNGKDLWRRPDQLRSDATKIVRRYDPFEDRRNRFLDYLLGMYGEKFSQSSLRRFNYCDTDEELERELIRNKIHLLKEIVEISRKRGAAFNYRRPSWNTANITSLKKKVGILLGWRHHQNRSLTIASLRQGLRVVSDSTYQRLKEGTLELQLFTLDDIAAHAKQKFEPIPISGAGDTVSRKKMRSDMNRMVPLKNNLVTESLLRYGIDLSRYRLGSLTAGDNYQVVFNAHDDGRWWYLANYPDKQSAVDSINRLRRFLLELNCESEGLHVVEHILLRLAGKSKYAQLRLSDGSDFYAFRISVILPSWTARCQDQNFRHLAEETVRLNCPAHILPQFYWLDFKEMYQFEDHYRKWLEKKSDKNTNPRQLKTATEEMIAFLLKHCPETQTGRRPQAYE